MMRRFWKRAGWIAVLIGGLLLIGVGSVWAQQQLLADYAIQDVQTARFEGDSVLISFTLVNAGVPTTAPATVELRYAATNAVITAVQQAPIPASGRQPVTLTVPLGQLAADSTQPVALCIVVYFDTPLTCTTADNSVATYRVPLPNPITVDGAAQPGGPVGQGTPIPTLSPALITPPGGAAPSLTEIGGFTLPFGIDLLNPLHIALLIGALGLLLILLWLLTVILRLLFGREPTFPSWQPPYGMSPMLNPNSTAGRRQLWQQHAMSDALPLPCTTGDFMARKILIGMNGAKLKNWRVIAGRISQYDMYGRVARTQTLLSKRTIKRLDSAARRSAKLTPQRAERTARPIAQRIVREFGKKLKRTPTLPISLDLRFRGSHGDVRIAFELYQCFNGASWTLIDHWEPEMQVPASTLQENFTYALYGQRPNEKGRAFRRRLTDDLTQMLAALIAAPPPVPAPAPVVDQPTVAQPAVPTPAPVPQPPSMPAPATERLPVPVSPPDAAGTPAVIALPPDASPAVIAAPEREPALLPDDTEPLRPVGDPPPDAPPDPERRDPA